MKTERLQKECARKKRFGKDRFEGWHMRASLFAFMKPPDETPPDPSEQRVHQHAFDSNAELYCMKCFDQLGQHCLMRPVPLNEKAPRPWKVVGWECWNCGFFRLRFKR